MKYSKTKADDERIENDLESNPIMRWLLNQDHFKFSVGDVLIKQTKSWNWSGGHMQSTGWNTEMMSQTTKTPKKYLYVFENSLGIGYLRPLKANGSGVTGSLICTANLDPVNTRFILDSDYADHIILGGDKDNFSYNEDYLRKKQIRDEGIEKNNKILVSDLRSRPKTLRWVSNLKPGDTFWYGRTYDELLQTKFEVIEVLVRPNSQADSYMKNKFDLKGDYYQVKVKFTVDGYGGTKVLDARDFYWSKVTFQQPFPLEDVLNGSS